MTVPRDKLRTRQFPSPYTSDATDDSNESLNDDDDATDSRIASPLPSVANEYSNICNNSYQLPLSSFRMIPRCHLDPTIPSVTTQHQLITQDKPDHRYHDESSILLSTPEPLPRSSRLHSPSPYNDVALVTKSCRRRRNLARINYYELVQNDTDQLRSNLLALPSTPETKLRADQESIRWENFIRGRLSLSFTPIIADYYRANKLGRRFTAKNSFPL